MSATMSDAPGWWAGGEIATIPHSTDLGHECGHARDRHDAEGHCLIDHRVVPVGGDEGTDQKLGQIILPPTGAYVREGCFCPGETVYHVCGWPAGLEWDTLKETPWRDPDAKKDANGRYQWYCS